MNLPDIQARRQVRQFFPRMEENVNHPAVVRAIRGHGQGRRQGQPHDQQKKPPFAHKVLLRKITGFVE
jgi:hypothetical protein